MIQEAVHAFLNLIRFVYYPSGPRPTLIKTQVLGLTLITACGFIGAVRGYDYQPGYGTTYLWLNEDHKKKDEMEYKRPEYTSSKCMKAVRILYRTTPAYIEQKGGQDDTYDAYEEQCMSCEPTKNKCPLACEVGYRN